MSTHAIQITQQALQQAELRTQAHSRLTGRLDPAHALLSASQAMGVLHELASSPANAADALALLHELQVYQVELDLQSESLQAASAELELALAHQVQRLDSAPVALLSVDSQACIVEVNQTAARQLGVDREALHGQSLDQFLTPPSALQWHAMLHRLAQGEALAPWPVNLIRHDGAPRLVYTSASADVGGQGFQVALMDMGPAVRT